MITRLELQNFGPLAKIDWAKLGHINLVIGSNGAGKTFLLKTHRKEAEPMSKDKPRLRPVQAYSDGNHS